MTQPQLIGGPSISIRIPMKLLEWVDQQAVASFRSRNAYIKDLIAREYMAQNAAGGVSDE